MQSVKRRQRVMRKVRTKVVIEGGGCAGGMSADHIIQLFLISSFRDALYLLLKGSVRMLPLLPSLRVPF